MLFLSISEKLALGYEAENGLPKNGETDIEKQIR